MRWPRWYWELHAKAYLDLLLDLDSRPAPPVVNGADDDGAVDEGADSGGSGSPDPLGPRTPPGAGILPVGFAGRLNLTIPLATLLKLADRPGEIPGLGPVDPWLAWDLARASASNPKTTWCLTVTGEEGHAIGHGCAARNQRPSLGLCRDGLCCHERRVLALEGLDRAVAPALGQGL